LLFFEVEDRFDRFENIFELVVDKNFFVSVRFEEDFDIPPESKFKNFSDSLSDKREDLFF